MPGIVDVQVIGVPDPLYGEELMAWVRVTEGMTSTRDDVLAFSNGRIAHFKVPRYLHVTDDFPMTVTGISRSTSWRPVHRPARRRDGHDLSEPTALKPRRSRMRRRGPLATSPPEPQPRRNPMHPLIAYDIARQRHAELTHRGHHRRLVSTAVASRPAAHPRASSVWTRLRRALRTQTNMAKADEPRTTAMALAAGRR